MKITPPAPTNSAATDAKPDKSAAPPAANRIAEYLPDILIDAAQAKVPVVNVFGEFSKTRKISAAVANFALSQHTFLDAGYDADVAIDPTGQALVFTGAHDGERTQIYLQRLDGSPALQLTQSAADDAQPCFSPDGKRIAFCSNRDGAWHLYLMNVDGRSVTQLTQGDTNDMHPSFSPDGARLVYSSLPAASGTSNAAVGGQWELRTIDLLSRQIKQIGYGLFPSWSPEKGRDVIVFQKTRARGSRWFSLWTCELNAGEATRVTEIAVSSNAALLSPAWSTDGKNLAFASIVEPADTRRGKPQGQQDIWTMAADGADRRRLTDGTSTNLTPSWAVDNRVYFVSDRSGHECIWSLPAGTNGADGTGTPAGEPLRETAKSNGSAAIDSPAAANETAEIKP